ncbi:hypothetical protein DFH06DRAFT_1168756 [Mycena polygramma]|nr:hypothetical protein DFH06DRAFT_1168756 [Mycena polygramma]
MANGCRIGHLFGARGPGRGNLTSGCIPVHVVVSSGLERCSVAIPRNCPMSASQPLFRSLTIRSDERVSDESVMNWGPLDTRQKVSDNGRTVCLAHLSWPLSTCNPRVICEVTSCRRLHCVFARRPFEWSVLASSQDGLPSASVCTLCTRYAFCIPSRARFAASCSLYNVCCTSCIFCVKSSSSCHFMGRRMRQEIVLNF